MKRFHFTFRNEAIWMMIFAFAPVVIGLLAVLVIAVVRS
jgi:hypothetical protein